MLKNRRKKKNTQSLLYRFICIWFVFCLFVFRERSTWPTSACFQSPIHCVYLWRSLKGEGGGEDSHCFRLHLISGVIVESAELCELFSLCWQAGRCHTLLILQAADVSPSRNVGFFFSPSLFVYFSFVFFFLFLYFCFFASRTFISPCLGKQFPVGGKLWLKLVLRQRVESQIVAYVNVLLRYHEDYLLSIDCFFTRNFLRKCLFHTSHDSEKSAS